MRSPEQVLKALNKHGKVSDYKFERLYRILFNEEMFHVAYQRIYAKPGNMTPGTDGKTINRMSLQRINKVIASLRDESYKPNPAKRIYIPKKNGKKRPLGIPSFEDKLVQEVVRMILEAVYEEVFANTSHGFRPNRSCHTALTHIQKTFTGTKWFVEGDIKGFFDNIDHNVLIATLRKRIADDRFLRLIRKLLNAGYIEDWKFHNTNKGTPQGGNISPILANIYLDNFDKYMEEYAYASIREKKDMNTGCHTDRNTFRTVDQKVRNTYRKYGRFLLCLVKVWHKVYNVLVQIGQICFLRDLRKPRFGITHCRCTVSFDRTKVTVSVYKDHPFFKIPVP